MSNTFFGRSWKESRFTVCSCSSSIPFWPFSDAGSNTVATMRSILANFSPRKASSARTEAAGCATTTGPGCNSGAGGWPGWRSIQGERVGGEESEVHALELFRADALNKTQLIAGRFQLSERLVVIQQPYIGSGEIPFVQDFGDLFSLERRRAHDRHAIRLGAAGIGLR